MLNDLGGVIATEMTGSMIFKLNSHPIYCTCHLEELTQSDPSLTNEMEQSEPLSSD